MQLQTDVLDRSPVAGHAAVDDGSSRTDDRTEPDEQSRSEIRQEKDQPKESRPTGDNEARKDGKGDEKKSHDDGGKPKKKSRLPLIILAAVVLLAVIGGAVYWFLTRNLESTDDAYTEGNATAIAPKVGGYVVERLVDDNTFVKAGQLLVRIDQRDYIAARDQAQANLALAEAQLTAAQIGLSVTKVRAPADLEVAQSQLVQSRANQTNAQRNYNRQHGVDPRATTQTDLDQANTQFASTNASVRSSQAQVQVAGLVQQNIDTAAATVKQREAEVAQAKASLTQAELNLGYTEIRAQQDGYITNRNVDVGTYAQPGQQVFYLVSPYTWIVANFKETQLARMRVGQGVDIDVDAYPKLKLKGHVESIQQGSGARYTAFPAENATGNFVKIVRRVPVKIVIDSGLDQQHGLPLGISVDPTVTVQ